MVARWSIPAAPPEFAYEATQPDMSDAEALTVLDRLGEPEDIIEAQRPAEPGRAERRGVHEWAAIFLLLFGGFIFVFGWIAGVVLLWSSRAWNTRDRLIGTLIVPGGLASVLVALLFGASAETCVTGAGRPTACTGGPSTLHQIVGLALLAFFLLGPICTSVYLARRAR